MPESIDTAAPNVGSVTWVTQKSLDRSPSRSISYAA